MSRDVGLEVIVHDLEGDTLTVIPQVTDREHHDPECEAYDGARVEVQAAIGDGFPSPFWLSPSAARKLSAALADAATQAEEAL